MKRFLSYILLLVFVAGPVSAAKKTDDSFADVQRKSLEAHIKDKYKLEELAHFQSQVLGYEQLYGVEDNNLKLFLAVSWVMQSYEAQAYELLRHTQVEGEFADLYKYYRATLFLKSKKMLLARDLVVELSKKYPDDPDVVFLQSHFMAQADNLLGALEVLDLNLKNRRKVGKTYLQRGLLKTLVFDYETAKKDFLKAIRKLPKTETRYRQMAHFQLGLIYLKNDLDNKKANRQFASGKKIDPNSSLVSELENRLRH